MSATWRKHAACRGIDPDVFYPVSDEEAAEAKAIALDALISKACPITDVRASAEYRLAMLRVLAKRAQRRAAERLVDGKKHG